MYYLLTNDILLDTKVTITEPQNLPSHLSFLKGESIEPPLQSPVVFTTSATKNQPLRAFLDCSYPLMSEAFLTLLKGAGVNNLQTFPAVIKSEVDCTEWDNYYVVNILGVVACADLSQSRYSQIMPGHYLFETLAIDAQKPNGALMFRLQEHKPSIMVHQGVLKYIVDHDPNDSLQGWEADDVVQ